MTQEQNVKHIPDAIWFPQAILLATIMSTESELQLKNRVYNKADKGHTTMAAVATPFSTARAKGGVQTKRKQKPAGKKANKKEMRILSEICHET